MNSQSAYPLAWPPAWKRTTAHLRDEARFFVQRKGPDGNGGERYTGRGRRSMNDCTEEVLRQLDMLGAQQTVISTNVELRNDGLPYSNRRAPADSGAAVYFVLRKRPCVLACDKWTRVEDNLWAIAKDIEAQRGRIRWGVGSVEQAFAGYTALPAPGESGTAIWYQILGVAHDAPFEVVKDKYYAEAKKCHPDNGGTHDAFVRLNQAWDMARAAYGK